MRRFKRKILKTENTEKTLETECLINFVSHSKNEISSYKLE